MGATFSRVKNWTTEVLSNTDLNAEIDNILNNLDPSGVDDYSTNAAQMRLTTNPGSVGSESLATSLAGELERLRYAIQRIIGSDATQWYSAPQTTLTDLNAAVGGGYSSNRISSGKTSSLSSQMRALIPSGTTTSITLDGSPTSFVYYVNDNQYSITADLTVTGLSAAPSSNATASIADAQAGDNQFSEFLGEYGTQINISAAGSEFASRVGQYVGLGINNGSATEYLIGYINSTTAITRAMRGCFINQSNAVVPRVRFTSGDSVTLLRLAWLFANTSSSIAVTYTTPTFSESEPSAPSTGDYWFDFANDTWKTYNSVTWVAANATLIGMTLQTSAACVAARTFDQFTSTLDTNTIELEWESNSQVRVKDAFASVNVFGAQISYGMRRLTWDMASHLESGLTEQASTYYYFYINENGGPVISDKVPLDLKGSRRGLYHPQETWRCIGCAFNDSGSNLDQSTLYTFDSKNTTNEQFYNGLNYRIAVSTAANTVVFTLKDRVGNYPSELIPTDIKFRDATAATGAYINLRLKSSPNITIPSGATLGHGTAPYSYVFGYLAYDSTPFLAVGSIPRDEMQLQNITAISVNATISSLYGAASGSSKQIKNIFRAYYTNGVNGAWTTPTRMELTSANYFNDDYLSCNIPLGTPASATAVYNAASANSMVLGPGDWDLVGYLHWNGTSSIVGRWGGNYHTTNGGNSGTVPAKMSTSSGVSVLFGDDNTYEDGVSGQSMVGCTHYLSPMRIRVTSVITAYLVPYSSGSGTGYSYLGNGAAKRVTRNGQ